MARPADIVRLHCFQKGIILDIILGIVGAIVGGWLFTTFGASGVTGLNLYSILVSVVVLVVYHAIRRAA